MRFLTILAVLAGPAVADPVADIMAAAEASFDHMPDVRRVHEIAGRCGADAEVNSRVVYCTSQNTIFLHRDSAPDLLTAYALAHVYGHAVQVQHGIADVALQAIRSSPSNERALRGDVTRQVECIAGFLWALAALPPTELSELTATEPFTGAHWGRNPLRIGPRVQIGLKARARWFRIGQTIDLNACAPGAFSSDLLVRAFVR